MDNNSPTPHARIGSRLKAVQIIYGLKFNEKPLNIAIYDALKYKMDSDNAEVLLSQDYTTKLCEYYLKMEDNILNILEKHLKLSGRTLDSCDMILIIILALAISEILGGLSDKPAITIKSWLQITEDFFPNPDACPTKIVHAVIDSVQKTTETF